MWAGKRETLLGTTGFFPKAVSVHYIISSFALSPYILTVCVAAHLAFCA